LARNDVLQRLRQLMARTTQVPIDSGVGESTAIAELGIDSLAMLDLIYDVQQEFGIEFDPQELVRVRTVGQLATFIEEHMDA
jgi:acyl carrier protein